MDDEEAGEVAICIQKVVAAAVKAVSVELAFDQVSVDLLVPGARCIAQSIAVACDLIEACRIRLCGVQDVISGALHVDWAVSFCVIL